MKMKHLFFVLLSVVALYGSKAYAQTDFYSLSKREKEARIKELVQLDFDTMMLDDNAMRAYHSELKRAAIYCQKKADRRNKIGTDEVVTGSILLPIAIGGAVLYWVVGVAVGVPSIALLVHGIVVINKGSHYEASANYLNELSNKVIPINVE